MKNHRLSRRTTLAAAAAAICLLAGGLAQAELQVEQTIELQPGWNSIWLEVQPEPAEVGEAFDGLPVTSVWMWEPGRSRVEYLRHPDDGLFDRPGWLGWFPPGPQQFLTEFHGLRSNRAYLVNYSGDVPAEVTVTGRPSLRPLDWMPDSFNLVGFPVDSASPPTIESFLSPSPAHAGQQVYRLAGGQWELVSNPSTETIARGEAYWVYTRGASSYDGPVEIELEQDDGLDYGDLLVERRIRFRNLSGGDVGVTVRPYPAGLPICYWTLGTRTNSDTGEEYEGDLWPDLVEDHTVAVGPGQATVLRLAVRRARLGRGNLDGLLEVTDGAGSRRLIPIHARSRSADPPTPVDTDAGSPGGSNQPNAHLQGTGGATGTNLFAGLWVGNVFVEAVNEPANDAAPLDPTPVATELGFRLLLHVDAQGAVKLLKQVTQMWEDGTLHPDGTVSRAGRYLLISDDDLLGSYRGAGRRAGESVGLRVSSAAYTFDASSLAMPGTFELGGSLSASLLLAEDDPTNPFRHAEHPDHDGVDDGTRPLEWESYSVQRAWTLDFATEDPSGTNPPEWGDTLMAGSFSETITGLRNDDIVATGRFEIRRVSDVAELNE